MGQTESQNSTSNTEPTPVKVEAIEDPWKDLQYEEVKKAVEGGDESSKTKLAWLKLSCRGGAELDEEGAVALLEERAKEGDDEAMWMLGVCNEYGIGVDQNAEHAVSLYKQSREKGNDIGKFFAEHGNSGKGSNKLSEYNEHVLVKALPITPWNVLNIRTNEKNVMKLVEFLKTNTTLTDVTLDSMCCMLENVESIAELLKENTTMTRLNLESDNIQQSGIKIIGEALMTNSTLTDLNLNLNHCGVNGTKSLCEMLKVNTSLNKLGLSMVGLEDEGVAIIAEALKANSALTELDLSDNGFGDEGAMKISESLVGNTTLTSLNLAGNLIRVQGGKKLADALLANQSLTELNLNSNKITKEEMKGISESLMNNSTVTKLGLEVVEDDGKVKKHQRLLP